MERATETKLDTQAEAQNARVRAAFYGFLGLHFNTLPDGPFVEQLREPACSAMLTAVVNDDDDQTDLAAGAAMMVTYLHATRAAPAAQLAEKLGIDRTRLYRGITPAYGPTPPYEMVWSKTYQDVTLLPLLIDLYRRAGLTLGPEAHERPDYIGIELDYLRALADQEAAAWDAKEPETVAALRNAQRVFLQAHLGAWVQAYVDRALADARTDFYTGHLLMLRGFIATEQQALTIGND